MEVRQATSFKENVPPRPSAPLRPESQRSLKSLGSGHGQQVPVHQPRRRGPAFTPSIGAMLHREPCPIQTNLARPDLSPGLTLGDKTGQRRRGNSSFLQQSNLQPGAGRPHRRTWSFAFQQSNLSLNEVSSASYGNHSSPCFWPEPQESFDPHTLPRGNHLYQSGQLTCPSLSLRQSRPPAPDTHCPDFIPQDGYPRPGLSSWCALDRWASGPVGEPLTLEDLTVPAQSQARTLSRADIYQLLASVRHLELKADRLSCWTSQELLMAPAYPEPSQPEKQRYPRSLRGKTLEAQAGLSDSQANSQPVSPKTAFGVLPVDPEQGVLPACPPGRGGTCFLRLAYGGKQKVSPGLPPEASLCSSLFSGADRGARSGRKGGAGTLREQVLREETRMTSSCPSDTTPVRSHLENRTPNIVTLENKTACGQLLPRCFKAWRHLVQRGWAMAAVEALYHRQLLRKVLRALRWTLHLREAKLNAAWGRHIKALLAQSFRKWRKLAAQQKQERSHVQGVPGHPSSGTGWDLGPSGREAAVDSTRSSSAGSLKKEEGDGSVPSHSGQRADGRDGRVHILQALQQLAVFLLWCHQKGLTKQKRGVQGEAAQTPPRTQRAGQPPQASCVCAAAPTRAVPLDTQHQKAWLCRCFGVWHQFVQREARCRDHLTDCRVRTLNTCLQQWVQMKQLRVLDGMKVTQLSLCQQKTALPGPAPGAAIAQDPGAVAQTQGPLLGRGRGSLQEACRKLALQRALQLWRMQLFQRQQANFFLQGLQQRTLQRVLRQWRSRVWGPCTLSSSTRTASSPKPLGSISGEESSLEKVPRDPALLGTLLATFLWAAGQQRQKQHLLLWQARAQQAQSAVRQYQLTLQRRVLLSWSHWITAQGARRELAARWAWARSCRVALGVWRQRLVQWYAAERWVQERDRGLARDALHHWYSCWQRQWVLHEKYQAWTQVHLQGLRSVVFQGWRRAAARQRHIMTRTEQLQLQSHFQAWRGLVREAGVLQAQCQAFQDSQLKRALGAAFAVWWAAQAQEQRMAQATITHWSRATKQSQAQQAFSVCPGTPHQHKVHWQANERVQVQAGVTLCWTLWVHETHLRQISRAHAARKLSIRVLEAWAQVAARARVQRAAFAQLRQARSRLLLWTHWAQWQTALLRMRLGAQTEVEETCMVHLRPRAGLRQCLSLASRGRLLLMEVPAQDQQIHSCWMQASGPALHHLSGQREWPVAPRVQGGRQQDLRCPPASCRPRLGHTVQLWLHCLLRSHGAQDLPLWTTSSWSPIELDGDYNSDGRVTREAHQRLGMNQQCWHLESLLHQLQASQQTSCLAAAWQYWVDAYRAEQLAQTLFRWWHLRWAWGTWRRRVLQLWVAQRFRQQENSCILSQAFEKWHKRLAARGLRSSANSSLRPPGKQKRKPSQGKEL